MISNVCRKKISAFQITQWIFLKQGLIIFHWIAFNCHNLFFSHLSDCKLLCTFICIIGCWTKWPLCCHCVLVWIPPSSEGCYSLVKQVVLVTKNVYNTSGTGASLRFSNVYVSQPTSSLIGKGWFAEVLFPLSWWFQPWLVPCVCRVPLF